jgi:flagellar basal-body rod protein FlgB
MNQFEIGKKLFDKTMGLVQRSLDIRAARHQWLWQHRQCETPDYLSKDLPSRRSLSVPWRALGSSLKRTHRAQPALEEERTDFPGNRSGSEPGVDVDQQMAKLAENNLMFQAGIQSLIKKFEALKVSVTETR